MKIEFEILDFRLLLGSNEISLFKNEQFSMATPALKKYIALEKFLNEAYLKIDPDK